ncbi:MAG TPA: FAD-binding protein, partial [Nitriliruptorales bacterium]
MSTDQPAPPTAVAPGHYRTDVLVIGAGVAGLYACVTLPDHLDVLVLDKGEPASGSSPLAQGGMAVVVGGHDTPELHAADTTRAGDGLCDPAAVRVLTREAPEVTGHLLELGARFDTSPVTTVSAQGTTDRPPALSDLHVAREGGQAVARSVHRADATGAELVRVLRRAARGRVRRLGGVAVSLACGADGRVRGAWALTDAGVALVQARAVLLATGGCGGLFAATTNRDHATGDGLALAYLAGAAVRDTEFVQFHPTGLAITGSWRLLLTEALRGAGATLHDGEGTRFMPARHPDAELAPRHVVAKAIIDQPDGAW